MIASVILTHPYVKSFNHAIYRQILNSLSESGVQIFAHDLYEEGFNPVLTRTELGTDISTDKLVNQYSGELLESDLLFFIHPNWWGQPPAILKGYIDRVIRPPHAYDFADGDGGGLPITKLDGKYGIVYNTSNTDKDRELDYFGDPLENIWKKCIFGFCGIEKYYRKMFRIVSESSQTVRDSWLIEVSRDVSRIVAEMSELI